MPLLVAMDQLLDMRAAQLPHECGKLVLESGPEQALVYRALAVDEQRCIQYTKDFISHVSKLGNVLDR